MRSLLALFLLSSLPLAAQMTFEKTVVSVTVAPDAKEIIAEFPFTVKEKGAQITNYDAPCSCLSARIEPVQEDGSARLKWEPGATGKVLGKFELGNFKGVVDKAILLNLKGQEPIQLIVKVKIPELVAITPATHRWVQGITPDAKSFKVKINGDEPIRITSIRGTNANFPHELITVKEGREYEIKIKPVDTATPMLGMIRFNTDSKFRRFKRQQVFAVVQAPK